MGQKPRAQKTTINRLLLFFVIGFTTIAPLYIVGFFVLSWVNIFILPGVIFISLIIMAVMENRKSNVEPRWLEYLLASVGAFYPSVLVTIVIWIVWWIAYFGLEVFLGLEGGVTESAYSGAGIVYGLLSLVVGFFLVRLNWRHLTNQLYPIPIMGSQSAFAQTSKTGKTWLITRGIILSIIWIIIFIVIDQIQIEFFSEGEALTIGDDALLSLPIFVLYLFLISISAWLWLRSPEPPDVTLLMKMSVTRLLQPLGYEVQTLAETINKPGQDTEVSDPITISVDLVACRPGHSIVIDIRTEDSDLPDSGAASEFLMATWYLKRKLSLPTPLLPIFLFVDVIPDDTMASFAQDYDIRVVQLSTEEVIGLWAQDTNEAAFQETAEKLFPPAINNELNNSSLKEAVLENGGRNE
jgi:hypothetical protein